MSATPAPTPEQLKAALDQAIRHHGAGDLQSAESLYLQVLRADATQAVALHNLGHIRLSRGDQRAALELIRAAAALQPANGEFHYSLGVVQQNIDDLPAAIAAYREAARLLPRHLWAWTNLGVTLFDAGEFEPALDACDTALQIDPSWNPAEVNRGNILRAIKRLDEAEAQYRQVLDREPLNANVAVKLATCRLLRGDFSAWQGYEWRYWDPEWLQHEAPYHVPLPKWDGSPLQGDLLLYGEQGIGDEIMFASIVADAAALARRTVLLCEPRLAPLFARSFPGLQVQAKASLTEPAVLAPHTTCSRRCSLASLPALLRQREQDFPGTAFLRADPAAVEHWRGRLAQLGGRLHIGLSWRGGAGARARQARSIALAAFAPLFGNPGVRVIDLQYGDHADEIAAFNQRSPQPLVRFAEIDPLQDMDGFAALITALDVVVTIDNSTAHLAGALGVPTWVLLPHHADWRWMLTREDSPWYSSLRLFRQTTPGQSWDAVVARVGDELTASRAGAKALPATTLLATPAVTPIAVLATPDLLLLNDTSCWYHWGCTGTSLALHDALRAAGRAVDALQITRINALTSLPRTVEELDDNALFAAFSKRHPDILMRMAAVPDVVINGEGSLHAAGQTARALLYLAWIAKARLGRRVHVINHSCYPEQASALYAKVYGALDHVAVREPASARQLQQLGIAATQSFDCLPLFIDAHPPAAREDGQRRVVMAGCVQQDPALINLLATLAEHILRRGYRLELLMGANAHLAGDDVRLVRALHPRLRGRYTLVTALSEQQWLQGLTGADLLISGRFHHSIAAACLGTPFVVTASNTRKIDGLLECLQLDPAQVSITPADIPQALQRVDTLLEEPDRGKITSQRLAMLQGLARRNFTGLGTAATI